MFTNDPDVSIIIVSYNTEQITYDCIRSIFESETKYKYEIILVDNNSADRTVERLQQDFPTITIITSDKNLGFSKGNNIGIDKSKGNYILLLNSDTLLFKDSLENLLQSAIEKNYQITGPVLLNIDRSIQRSWFNFPSALKTFLRLTDIYLLFYRFSSSILFKLFYFGRKPAFMVSKIDADTKMNYLTFACILIKRNVIEGMGKLDEDLFFYQEDCEFGLRARKNGYEFMYCVSSKIIHLGGTSSGKFSWIAFENDILGILHIYKKHYTKKKFNQVKLAILLALRIRITFSYLGFYNHLKKSGLYFKEKQIQPEKKQIRGNYIRLMNSVKNFDTALN